MPVVISSSVVENQPEQPLTHARIGYQSVVQLADTQVTASTQAAGFEADALKEHTTYDRWRASNSDDATISIATPEAVSANYVGIAGHNLGSVGATVSIEHSADGTTWSLVEAVQASDNSALMILFAEVKGFWRLRLTGMTATPTIAVLYLGEALAMQRAIYQGHSPINLSRQTDTRPSVSEGGQWLGRSVVRRSLRGSYSWSNLGAAWYRAKFEPFVKAARYRPFFIAWRPQSFPPEVAYGWTNEDIQPTNSGPRDFMSVNLNVTAHAEE